MHGSGRTDSSQGTRETIGRVGTESAEDRTSLLTPPGNLVDLLLGAVESWPTSGIHYVTDERIGDTPRQTYPALFDEARRILGGLRAEGLSPGDRVVLLLDRAEEILPTYWGCLLGGFIPAPLAVVSNDPDRWEAQLAHISRLLDQPHFVISKNLRTDVPPSAGRSLFQLEELAAAPPAADFHRAASQDLAMLVLTSGSTSSAKAVMLSHANLLAAVDGKAGRLNPSTDDVTMNWIAFDHIAAMEMHLMPMSVGANQVQVDHSVIINDPVRFLHLVDRYRISLTFSPNFLLGQINAALAHSPADLALDLTSLRHLISGGEATVCATAHSFLDRLSHFGLARDVLVPGFGMTETCAGSIFSTEFPDIDVGQEFASLGLPVRSLEMRVVDADDEQPLPDGAEGELQLRGPMVFTGYLNNPAATAAAFTPDGWFRTGDRARIDDGRLRLVGRSKDSIIVNGVNYFSHELEAVLEHLDGVEKSWVAAFPTRPPGSDTEQLVIAFSPTTTDEAEIHRLLIAIRNSVVLHWGFRPALILPLPISRMPAKTSLGKIQRVMLRRQLESGEFDDVQQWVTELAVRQLGGHTAPDGPTEIALAEVYAEIFDVPLHTVSATASFFDLGGTSLDILRLKRAVEQRLRHPDLPVVELLRAPTIRQLASQLDQDGRRDDDGYQPLITLQRSGDKTPLFCVHPGVGEVLVFVNLAKYFVNERPFHALRARGFGAGESHFASFDEMVHCYVQAIRAEQPTGPYAVAGYSYGGVIAFEIAKALEALGERVDFVGIFNLPPHIRSRMDELDPTEGAINLAFFLSLITKEQAAGLSRSLRNGRTIEQQFEYLIELAPKQRLVELDLDLAKFTAWVQLAQSLVRLGQTYEPSGTVRSVSVFYAIPLRGSKEDWLNNQLRAWDRYTREPNRYIDVAGEHYTLMGPRHVSTFQATLRAELDRALDGN